MKTIQINNAQAKRLHYIIQNFVNDEQSLNNVSHWILSNLLSKIIIQHHKYLVKLKNQFELGSKKSIDKSNKADKKIYLLHLQQAEYNYLSDIINNQDVSFLIDNELVNLFEIENRKILNQ